MTRPCPPRLTSLRTGLRLPDRLAEALTYQSQGNHVAKNTISESNPLNLSQYLDGLTLAASIEALEAAIQAPRKHNTYHGPTWSRICKVRDSRGREIAHAHPLGQYMPRWEGRKLVICGEIYGSIGRSGNAAGHRYAMHSAGEFAQSVLKARGFSKRAAYRIWGSWAQYPHRCIAVIQAALDGDMADPLLDTLIYTGKSCGPVAQTVEANDACPFHKRATMPCKCGGTLFDWGGGYSDTFFFVTWHCNKCPDTYTEYLSDARRKEVRQPSLRTSQTAIPMSEK